MVIQVLRFLAMLSVAYVCGKCAAKIRLPAILGWLVAGVVFGPYLAGVATPEMTNALWYKITVKFFECFAGVMIGREIVFKKLAKS
ncbi:MAG: potassium transporter, partial [Candidatus Gallimonas sp.]